jgi:hypothetical protein
MKRSSEIIDRLTVKQITLESKNGSVTLSADNNDGRVRFEPLNKVESGSFVVDLKNESIAAENAFIKKINFYDGTYLDSAALISETIGIVNQGLKTIELKPNKIFFKYNGDNTPGAGQQIEIKVLKPSSLTGTPVLTITPDNVGIALNQTASDTYILTVAEFDKASADTIQIQATLINAQGTFTDILTIYKTRDGTDALVGGLSNPFLALQANSGGQVTDLATILSSKAIGTFTVFKGSDDLTNSGKVTYAVGSVTDNLTASINPTTGIYVITNWSPDELVGEAIFTATDNVTNQQIKGKFTIITSKQGETGLTGNGARTVKLIADDQQIAYKADDELLTPTSIQVTASQQNHVGTVYYEFIVYEGLSNIGTTLYNGTNDNILLTNTNKNYGNTTYTFIENTKTEYGKSKTLKVRTRENSPSAPIISSEDVINIIATRDGSDAFEIVFSNTNHSFPANSSGEVAPESYAGGGSIVEAYIGNEQLSPVLGVPANGQFTVAVSEQQNITSGLIQPDPNSAIKRMNIGDPSNFISNKDSGSITYTITGKSSNGVSKTQLEKVSFTKSKQGQQGLPGSSGVDARAVELVSNVYQFNYNSSNTASPSGGFTLTASAKNTTGTVTYRFYKNNVLITTQAATTLARTDIPAINNSDSWKVEMLEDGIVKAIDTLSLYGTKDGSDAITLIVPNDNHTFTADSAGGSINFAGSGTTIKILVGSTFLNATTSFPPSSGQFNASLSGVAGITLGSITVTAADTLTLGQATAFGSDSGTATLTVNFRRPGSTTTETVTRILTYSKSKQGQVGATGATGLQGPQGLTGNPGPQGVQGPEGPEGNNPEDIGLFTAIYIDSNGKKYPWGWGRIQNVNSDLQTVLNNSISAPVEEKLVYDTELSSSVQPSSAAKKGGYVFQPQRNLSVTTNTFCYTRPLPVDSNLVGRLKFEISREAATGIGNTKLGVYFLNENFEKLTASDGNVLHFIRTFNGINGTANGISNSNGISDAFFRPVVFYFNFGTSPSSTYSPAAQTGNAQSGDFVNISMVKGITIPTNAKYAIVFIHNSGATNSRIIVDTARWWSFNYLQQNKNNKVYIGYEDAIDEFNPPVDSDVSISGSLHCIGDGRSYSITTTKGISIPGTSNFGSGVTVTIDSTGTPLKVFGNISSSDDLLVRNNTIVGGYIDSSQNLLSKIRQLQVGQSADTARQLDVYGDARFDTNTLFVDSANNNVGIGTATPNSSYKLDVVGSARFDTSTLVVDSVNNKVGIGTTSPAELLTVVPQTAQVGDGARLGNVFVGYWEGSTEQACFTNYNVKNTATSYALLQRNDGKTYLNGASGFAIDFRVNNITQAYVDTTNTGGRVQTTFTGQHKNISDSEQIYDSSSVGLIVVSEGQYNNIEGHNSITINQSLPKVILSTKRNQKNCFGVISNKEDSEYEVYNGNITSIIRVPEGDRRLIVNSVGEGAIWVCNINGNLENGDYITTCEIPGYGMKQDDDLLHNYTVAKITCDCNFDLSSSIYICEEFEFSGSIYRKAFVGCTYHCG